MKANGISSKLTSAFLACALLATLTPLPAFADSDTVSSPVKESTVAFNLTQQSKDESQVKVENGTFTALVTKRLSGNDCFGTNLATLKADVSENGLPKGIIVCTNTHYVDSLSAAALSGLLNYPIVIANGSEKQMNSTVKQSINVVTNSGKQKLDVVILGGTVAISSGIESQLKAYDANGKCDRVYGSDGYDTNQKAYEYGKSKNGGWNTSEVLVATGSAYYDALGSGSYAASKKAFILLANPSGNIAGMLSKINKGVKATICGGVSAVSSSIESSIKAKGCTINRIAGDDAYKTNIKFVQYSVKQGMKLEGAGVSTGTGYWDALGSSHILGASNSVMFLVSPTESLNQDAYNELKNSKETITKTRIFGGSAAVTDTTKNNLRNSIGSIFVDAPICNEDHPYNLCSKEVKYVKVKKPFTQTVTRSMYNNECGCGKWFLYLIPEEQDEPDLCMRYKQTIAYHWPSGKEITEEEAKVWKIQNLKDRWGDKYAYITTWDQVVDLKEGDEWIAEAYKKQPLRNTYTQRQLLDAQQVHSAMTEMALYEHQFKPWDDYKDKIAEAHNEGKLTDEEYRDVSWSYDASNTKDVKAKAAQEKIGIKIPVRGTDYHPYNWGFWRFKTQAYQIYRDSYVATCKGCGGVKLS